MKKIATIFDFVRFCRAQSQCYDCPIQGMSLCRDISKGLSDINKVNKIILDWCDQNPAKTRQSEFLKHYPNANFLPTGNGVVLAICPKEIDTEYIHERSYSTFCKTSECLKCKQEYWFTEINEKENE